MCRQVFGKEANTMIEDHHVVMCGFGLIDDRIYFDSEILNTDKYVSSGYRDDNINCGPDECHLILGALAI